MHIKYPVFVKIGGNRIKGKSIQDKVAHVEAALDPFQSGAYSAASQLLALQDTASEVILRLSVLLEHCGDRKLYERANTIIESYNEEVSLLLKLPPSE